MFGVVEMAKDEYMRVKENVLALPALLTTMMTVAEYGQAVIEGIKKAVPEVAGSALAALKWLPWVALGVGGLVVYSYATAPKRMIASNPWSY